MWRTWCWWLSIQFSKFNAMQTRQTPPNFGSYNFSVTCISTHLPLPSGTRCKIKPSMSVTSLDEVKGKYRILMRRKKKGSLSVKWEDSILANLYFYGIEGFCLSIPLIENQSTLHSIDENYFRFFFFSWEKRVAPNKGIVAR